MPGISGFGAKTEVGQFQSFDQLRHLLKQRIIRPHPKEGMEEDEAKERDADHHED